MLFSSLVEAAVKNSLDKAQAITPPEAATRARTVVDYYTSVQKQQDHLQDAHNALHDKKEKWAATPKVVYNIVRAITSTMCSLYGDPVIYRWDDSKEGARAAELFGRIKGWAGIMRDLDIYTFLSSLVAARPVWQDDEQNPLRMAMYLPDQITYTMEPTDMTVAQELLFTWMMGQGENQTKMQHLWSKKVFLEIVDDTIVPDKNRPNNVNPYGVIPVILSRNGSDRWEFYPEPAFDLVVANMTLNGATTMLNLMALKQGFATLMTIGAPDGFKPTVGIDSYINVVNAPGTTGAGAQYLNPGADFTGVISAINTCLSMFFASRRIPEAAIMAKQVGDSGVALVAQAAALVDYRKERIAVMRPTEEALIRMALRVMEWHETGNLVDFPAPQITYTELRKAMSTDERDEWDWRISHKANTELDLFKSLHPGMTDDDAKAAYIDNAKADRLMAVEISAGARADKRAADDAAAAAAAPPAGAQPEPVEDVAKTAMNGAQVQALQGIVQSVASGQLPSAAAYEMILMSFPALDPQQVSDMLGAVDAALPGEDEGEGDDKGGDEGNPPRVSEGQGEGTDDEDADEDVDEGEDEGEGAGD